MIYIYIYKIIILLTFNTYIRFNPNISILHFVYFRPFIVITIAYVIYEYSKELLCDK